MHSVITVAALFGLRAPELMAVLIILLVFFSGQFRLVGGAAARRGFNPGLTSHERNVLIALGALVAIDVAIRWVA